MKKRILYYAPLAARTGLAVAAHDYLQALVRNGTYDVTIRTMVDASTEDLPERHANLLPLVSEDVVPAEIVCVHTTPKWASEFVTADLLPGPGVKKVCNTIWEVDALGRREADSLNENFDLTLVPTHFTRDVFRRSGVKRVEVLSHTFDKDHYFVDDTTLRPDHPFVFLSIGVWAERKNPIGLLKAYLSEFEAHEDVVLKMVTAFPNQEDIAALIRCIGIEDLPRVEFLSRRYSDLEMREFHLASHAYVSATRGEGWNLGAFEAALVGNPVIVPRWSGHREFLDRYPATRYCNFQMTPAVITEQLSKPVKIGNFTVRPLTQLLPVGVCAKQNWAEPDLVDLKREMRKVFNERPKRLTRHRGRMLEEYGYETIGKSFVKYLEAL